MSEILKEKTGEQKVHTIIEKDNNEKKNSQKWMKGLSARLRNIEPNILQNVFCNTKEEK